MQFNQAKYKIIKNWLVTIMVGFLALAPLSPAFVLAQADTADTGDTTSSDTAATADTSAADTSSSSQEDSGNTFSQDVIDQVTSDPSSFIDDVLNDPLGVAEKLGIGPGQNSNQDNTNASDPTSDGNSDTNNTSGNTSQADNNDASSAQNSSDGQTTGDTSADTTNTGDTTGSDTATPADTTTDTTTDTATDTTTDTTTGSDTATTTDTSADQTNGDSGSFIDDVINNPQDYINKDTSQPDPGSGAGAGVQTQDSSSPGSDGGNMASSSSSFVDLLDINGLRDSLPTNADEARAYRDEHFDKKNITTEATDGSATSTSTTIEPDPTTTADNQVSGDDNIVGSTASTTDSATIGSNNDLTQENVTDGAAVSGDNTLESDKDVLEGTITTGTSDITSQGEVKGNTSDVSPGSGGGGGGGSSNWVQKLWGAQASNDNSGDDNVLLADGQEVRELTVLNKNKAFVSNIKELLAKSGGNRISAANRFKDGGIFTGASNAKSSLLNIINTNTVGDSAFLPLTFDLFDSFTGNINILQMLFDAFGANLDGPSAVTSTASNNNNTGDDSVQVANSKVSEFINIDNENEGYIYNDLGIKGISGQNQIIAGHKAKDSKIVTGDVNLANNLINYLNTNLFNSKIGVVVINVFADWTGNLILPGASKLASNIANPNNVKASTSVEGANNSDSLNSALAIANSKLDIVSENLSGVETKINVDANTGDNYAVFDKRGKDINVKSGDTQAQTNLLTLANRDIVGLAFSQGFFNIIGDWTGSLSGVASNARVEGNAHNFVVADEASALSDAPSLIAQADNNSDNSDDSMQVAVAEADRSVKINNNNKGRIVNHLDLVGDSGNNEIASYKGQNLLVETGDVKSANNISNFINNNFSFSKGLTVALNVFGKWQGNIAYDELKDLSVDVSLVSDEKDLKPGDSVVYSVDAFNSGTKPTDPGTVSFSFDASRLELVAADDGAVSGNTITWPFPGFESAGKSSFKPTFRLRDNLPDGLYTIEASAHTDHNDDNLADNTDIKQFKLAVGDVSNIVESDNTDNSPVDNSNQPTDNTQSADNGNDNNNSNSDANPDAVTPGSGSNGGGGGSSYVGSNNTPGYLQVVKTNEGPGPYSPGDTVKYKIVVKNPGNSAVKDVMVYDKLKTSEDDSDASWPLQDVNSGEEVTIEYEIALKPEAVSGTYSNTAYASGFDYANAVIKSNLASTEITVDNPDHPANSSLGFGAGGGAIGSSGIGGVITEFNPGASSTAVITNGQAAGQTTSTSTQQQVKGLSDEDARQLEADYKQQIEDSSQVSRYIPVAAAAEGVYLNAQGQVLGVGDESATPTEKLAYAVYPDFLHFDGRAEGSSAPVPSHNAWYANWLIWSLFIIALIIGYFSYREKKKNRLY